MTHKPKPTAGSRDPNGVAASGAMRDGIATKIPSHLVPFELIAAAAVAFNYGAEKYAARNFEKGFPLSSLLNSVDRHTRDMMAGEVMDADSGLPHYCMLAASVGMLCHNIMQGVVVYDIPARHPGNTPHDTAAIAKMAQAIYAERLKIERTNG